ncbi:1-phosphofructokinase family hexose kinase [Nocardiopsis sp. MG754419]|uniref:1-phosphofructokinase family hexose kinase n=1 Tax=Nocardiopsis sp. MG754419 TaxID=2259865 RepID=UPI001BABF0A6|nr:1-phosphofructokinase family hexose kinase [Nocardiopsis sp. MG754419]MBR8744663.1 1-phosphofructokinase [Nocardiopsis sp. MG754419]
MILTLTPNPSVDHTLEVDDLVRGEVLRVRATRAQAGGKGVNVARALLGAGVDARAVLPVGGGGGAELTTLLGDLPRVTVPIEGETRGNVAVTEPDGTTTKLNAAGPTLSSTEIRTLLQALEDELAKDPDWVVASGSLPAGAPDDLYVRVAELAASYGVPLALDTSGAPLGAAARAGSVELLKPNLEELADLVGHTPTTVGAVTEAAREVLAKGNGAALITLGGHGALYVGLEEVSWARGPRVRTRSTVGAGDCALAGFLAHEGTPEERLRQAVAWGTAAVSLPGTTLPGPGDVTTDGVTSTNDPDPQWRIDKL